METPVRQGIWPCVLSRPLASTEGRDWKIKSCTTVVARYRQEADSDEAGQSTDQKIIGGRQEEDRSGATCYFEIGYQAPSMTWEEISSRGPT